MLGSVTATLLISNEEMNNIIEIDKSLEESGLLIKGIKEAIKVNQKNKKVDFIRCILLGTLGASLLGNINRQRDNKSWWWIEQTRIFNATSSFN